VATPQEASNSELGWKIIGIALAIIALVVYLGSGSSTTASKHPIATTSPPPPPVVVSPPKPDRPLNRDEVRELQTLLKKQGFNAGTADGVMGPKTRTAAKGFASAHQVKDAPGEPTLQILDAVRGH
jgi:peptidoglycan hydrolase-like protein with peptidoglycan-binding domain